MKRLLYVLLIMIFWQNGFAEQDYYAFPEMKVKEPKSLLSPNVATLGTFCEPNVALYTGAPSISIPLFEVPLQDFVLPITLQYNGTSILVDQPPSWVGLGWNLSAGGVITRKVNDEPDDHTYSSDYYKTDYSDPRTFFNYNDGFYYSYRALDTIEWFHFKPKTGIDNTELYYNYYYFYDTEPDEFSFSFPGYQGHFYLNHHGKWEVQCSKSVSVELISAQLNPPFSFPNQWENIMHIKRQPPCFAGFILTIEDGTQYVFGNDTNAIEFCTDFFTHKQIMHANAWHLTKIILPNKQKILFTYQRQGFTNQMSYYYGESNYSIDDTTPSGPLGLIGCWELDLDPMKHIIGKLISPVYLREIHTPAMSVELYNSVSNDLQYQDSIYMTRLSFLTQDNPNRNSLMPYVTNFKVFGQFVITYNNYLPYITQNLKRYKLDSIIVRAVDSVQKISLNYEEINSSRLSLKEVVFSDNSTFHFEYNHLHELPNYLSFMNDHWGYFNNTSSLQNGVIDVNNYYLNLEPNPIYSKYGLLTDLYHPTGSVTRFEYESNDYRRQVVDPRWGTLEQYQINKYGGGCRIRKISHFENVNAENPTVVKEYFYKTNYIANPNSQQSSGILGDRFMYRYTYSAVGMEGITIEKDFFSTHSVLPNLGSDAAICYSEVTEKNSLGGYIVYKYSNFSDYLDEIPLDIIQEEQIAYGKYTSNSLYRGLLLSKQEYNDERQSLHKVNISYTPNKSVDKYVRSVNVINFCACNQSNGFFEEGASYKIYTHTMVPETIRDVWYSSAGDSIVKTTKNHYNLQTQMLTQTDVMTLTDTITQKYSYPFTIRSMVYRLDGPYVNDLDEVCAKMIMNHYFLPLEITSYKRNKATESIFYHYGKHNTQNPFYAVDSVSVLGISEPISFSPVSLSNKDSHYIIPAKQSCQYDAYGNITEIVTDGVPVSYVWSINHTYVVAKIVGLYYSQVQRIINSNSYHTIIMSLSCPTLNNLTSFRAVISSAYPQAQCYTYQYNPLYGIISETDPKGQTLFYDYDAMGRLKEVYYKEDNVKRVVKKYKYHLKDFE